MVTVGLYIYINGVSRRIELFDDEKISINSSVQNASDISKVYTDFSQSFTVPANDHNNAIFSHWYENSIDGGFDARKRKKAYIELDTIPFRNGNIQLEKATIKNGVPENYTITFFGSLVSLKDTFAGLKLSELDYSAYSFAYSEADVVSRVTGQINNDIKFPLISSARVWNDTNGSNDNITTPTLPTYMNASELFPALRLSKVFEAIESSYGITFNGSFLTDPRFTRAFLWLKNADVFTAKGETNIIDFNSVSGVETFASANLTTNQVTLTTLPIPSGATENRYSMLIKITTSALPSSDTLFKVNTFRNGVLYSSTIPLDVTSATAGVFLLTPTSNIDDGLYYYTIEVLGSPASYTSVLTYNRSYFIASTSTTVTEDYFVNQSVAQTASGLDLAYYMPDIKVEDFFSGVLKMFNLTCLGYEENVYTLEQLEDWYDDADIIDVTKHIISDDLEISKLETFNKINFNYTKSESFMNVAYLSNAGFEYGNLKADLDADGSEYTVQLPFENLLFNKFTAQNLQVGYSLKTDFKPYIPKPIILYDLGIALGCNFYIRGGSTTTNATTYNCFGQDTIINGFQYSLNFGAEISSLTLNVVTNSLYSNYYQSYLENIYNLKSRKYNVKAILPISLLTYLKLNNRLVIRDKRYIINNMKIDLTSGEVDLELINDFRTEVAQPLPPEPLFIDYSDDDYTEDYYTN
jgi:hypothetical protein